jgi:hypothetical protein
MPLNIGKIVGSGELAVAVRFEHEVLDMPVMPKKHLSYHHPVVVFVIFAKLLRTYCESRLRAR